MRRFTISEPANRKVNWHGKFLKVLKSNTHLNNKPFYVPYFTSAYKGQDQDQDSLLVKHRNDNHSPGPVIRELVPSSHQRSELSNTILCIFSRWDQRIGEGIPIPDSLGEEATFINICISNWSLKCHRVLISTTPSFGKVEWQIPPPVFSSGICRNIPAWKICPKWQIWQIWKIWFWSCNNVEILAKSTRN